MGVEPFLISSSVIAILAQRLVRVICPECKEAYTPTGAALKEMGLKESVKFYKGKGCDHCKGSGYAGRTGIHELMVMSDEVKKLVVAKASALEIRKVAMAEGMVTLRGDGLNKVIKGITTPEEIVRVTEE
jgi:type II secretory ATPase GspE/PulE/Tfp pilus assembly ATPase PilB-like protein